MFYFVVFCLPLFRSDLYFCLSPPCCRVRFISPPPCSTLLMSSAALHAHMCCSTLPVSSATLPACLRCSTLRYILFLFCLPPFCSDSYFRLSPPAALLQCPLCFPATHLPCSTCRHPLPLHLPICAVRFCLFLPPLRLPVPAVRLWPFLLALLMLCIVSHRICSLMIFFSTLFFHKFISQVVLFCRVL